MALKEEAVRLKAMIGIVALGLLMAQPVASQSTTAPPVKKSKSGICHDTTSSYYKRTKHFTPYETLEECLASGGRLPKK